MGVHISEIYAGRWYLRIRYRNIRVTKAVGSKERAVELKKKLTTALELYGLDAFRVLEEEKERTVRGSEPAVVPTVDEYRKGPSVIYCCYAAIFCSLTLLKAAFM